MCITRGEVLQIYEELGIFCWIAYKSFCLLTLLGARYSLRQAQGPRMGGSGTARAMRVLSMSKHRRGIPFLDKPSEQSSSATSSGTACGGLGSVKKNGALAGAPGLSKE